MWTLTRMRDNISNLCSDFFPARQGWKLSRRLSRGMTHKKCSKGLTRVWLLLAVALTLAVPASAEWTEKVLYSFQGGTNDGSVPAGGVVFDSQGNLYGATTDGGPASCAPIGGACGTVFQLSPPAQKGGAWTETLIYRFKGKGSNDASVPNGGLILDAAGNLYGVTAYGGTGDCVLLGVPAGCGTVYELSPPKEKGGAWTRTILYSFPTAKQGYVPNGDLVFDSAGNLYGATVFGGGKGTTCDKFYQYCGAVFELSPPRTKGGKWTEKVLHQFAGVAPGKQYGDGANPNGGLVLDNKGNIFGTTFYGGNASGGCGPAGCGRVFELQRPALEGGAWTERVLHNFNGQEGATPAAGVIFDPKGNLFGTGFGGGSGYGVVFELKKPSGSRLPWKIAVLHGFSDGNDGANPAAPLVFDGSGYLYGTTQTATNRNAQGNVVRMKPPIQKGGSWAFSVLYTFAGNPDGAQPSSPLVLDQAGNVYGTTEDSGSGTGCGFGDCGTVYEVSP
jgi:hypothetical protein